MDADPRDARIRELEAENARLRATIDELLKRITQLEARREELERAAHRQAAPFRRPEKKRKPPEQHRRIGRPKGHKPDWRRPPDHVDEEVTVSLERCPHCGDAVTEVTPCEQFIEDLPPTRPHVTRLVTHVGQCARCGEVRSTHPAQVSVARGAAGTHIGARALALATFLNKHLGLPMRKTCQVLKQLGGLTISPGGLSQALDRVARRSAAAFDRLAAGLRCQPAVYVDETGWWLGGVSRWLWGFTTPERTVYRVDSRRGRDVVLEMMGEQFGGVLISDCLASYENLPYTLHKCYAHHLKAISEARDRAPPEEHAAFDELALVLKSALALKATRAEMSAADYARVRQNLEQRADAVLARRDGLAEKVRERIRKRRRWLFTFLDHETVEGTNNRAERALRPAVIARKLSAGNKTERGARTWEILASLAATCAQRGHDLVDFLRPQITTNTIGR
jgi:transposase